MSTNRRTILEICIASVEDAILAASAGADRLELNSALSLGGLTPSLGTLLAVRQSVKIPIIPMIRPRAGGFCYSDAEFNVIQRDVDLVLEHGADGIAFGVLSEDNQVDVARCGQIVKQCGGRQVVFHRAFDLTPDPIAAMRQLADLGITRILTSGRKPTALAGAELIRELIERAAGAIEILPGGGIRAENVLELISKTGCGQIHASCGQRVEDYSLGAEPELAGAFAPAGAMTKVDAAAVAALRRTCS